MNKEELTDADLTREKIKYLRYVDDEELKLYLDENRTLEEDKTCTYESEIYVSDANKIGATKFDFLNSEDVCDVLALCAFIAIDTDDSFEDIRPQFADKISTAKKYFKRWT